MNKIIITLAFICLVLPGCTEQEEQEVNYNYIDEEACITNSKTNESLCDCFGGVNIIKQNSLDFVICANPTKSNNSFFELIK